MEAALIILAILVAAGAVLYTHDRLTRHRHVPEAPDDDTAADVRENDTEGCCGMHITCEKDSLSTAASSKIEYYDDEELDRFALRQADSYDDSEIEQFRDILLTLLPDDIAGWARSLQLRQIELPTPVRDELLMIVAETRASRTAKQPADA